MRSEKNGYKGFYNRYAKHWIDIVFASIFAVILIPIYLIISLAIAIEDGFPVFYRPQRGGYHNKTFRIFKFRTMIKNADKIGGSTTALNDPRITRVGNILRKTKLDEIPQLFNIFAGTMSFIGPRPELLQYTNQYTEEEKVILEVRPGITDYSSVAFINLDEIVGSGNADEMYEKYVLKKKNELRIKYANEVSLTIDLKLFFITVASVIKKVLHFFFKKEEIKPKEEEVTVNT